MLSSLKTYDCTRIVVNVSIKSSFMRLDILQANLENYRSPSVFIMSIAFHEYIDVRHCMCILSGTHIIYV